MEATIYALFNGEIPFYIGQTTMNLQTRLTNHLCAAKAHPGINSAKTNIILSNYQRINIQPIELIVGNKKEILRQEEYWAHQFKSWGFTITNGCLYPRIKLSPEEKTQIENVSIHKTLMLKLKEHKKKTGTSIRFFVAQAIEEKLETTNGS